MVRQDRENKRSAPNEARTGAGQAPRQFRHDETFFPGLGSPEHFLLFVLTELWLTSLPIGGS